MIDWNVAHTICGIDELEEKCGREISHVLSILDPGWPDPEPVAAYAPHERLVLRFHDIIASETNMILPMRTHIEALLAFSRRLPDQDPAHILIHCHAGVSRSTAAATAMLLQAHPYADEDEVLSHIARIRPQAWPNSRMIRFADAMLGRRGRLVAALSRLYGRQLRVRPDFAQALIRGGRGEEVDMAVS